MERTLSFTNLQDVIIDLRAASSLSSDKEQCFECIHLSDQHAVMDTG